MLYVGMSSETQLQDTEFFLTMSGRRLKPLNDWVYARKCVSDHVRDENGEVLLYKPEDSIDGNTLGTGAWCEIIGIGPLCRYFGPEHIGKFALFPELVTGMHRLGSLNETVDGEVEANEDFCIRESVLMEHFCAVVEEE